MSAIKMNVVYVECRVSFTVMLCVIMLSVIMLNVVMLSVVAPNIWLHFDKSKFTSVLFKASQWIGLWKLNMFQILLHKHSACLFFYSGLWCSTKTNEYGHHTSGNWGICSDSCPTQGKLFKLTRQLLTILQFCKLLTVIYKVI